MRDPGHRPPVELGVSVINTREMREIGGERPSVDDRQTNEDEYRPPHVRDARQTGCMILRA